MRNFNTSGKNIDHNRLAPEIGAELQQFFFPDCGNDSVTPVLPAGFARSYCLQLFAV